MKEKLNIKNFDQIEYFHLPNGSQVKEVKIVFKCLQNKKGQKNLIRLNSNKLFLPIYFKNTNYCKQYALIIDESTYTIDNLKYITEI